MARDVRFVILNADEQYGRKLRASLLATTGVKIVAEVEEPALLAQAVGKFPVDVVLVNLDPAPDAILPVVAEVAKAEPALVFFATSESTDGPLILKTIRTGVREFLPKPIDGKALKEAVEKVASQCVGTEATGKLLTVMGTSGGVGATMLATNLAVELATIAKDSVTIVDLDYRFGQVTTLLDMEPHYTIADLCHTPEQIEREVVERTLVKHESGVNVLSRPLALSQAETLTAASCVGVLTTLLQFNEYVIADGPLRGDPSAKSVLDISDVNLMIVQLLVPTVRNASRILDALREDGYQLERTKLICNRIGREAASLSVSDVSETLKLNVFATIPDEWSTVSGAINLGESLRSYSPKSKVCQAIREIAERLHSPPPGTDDKDTTKKGLIGRILAK